MSARDRDDELFAPFFELMSELMKLRKVLLLIVSLLVVTSVAFAENKFFVSATYDKTTAEVFEEIRLTISVEGEIGNLLRPRLPAFHGFRTHYVQQSSRVISSQTAKSDHRRIEFVFLLVGQQEGDYVVGPFMLPIEGGLYRFEPQEIKITPSTQLSKYSQSSKRNLNSNASPTTPMIPRGDTKPLKNLNLEVTAGKTTVYPNEQVVLTYMINTRYPLRLEGMTEPTTKGFWVEEINVNENRISSTIATQGFPVLHEVIRKLALFPTAPGDYTVETGELKVSVITEAIHKSRNQFGAYVQDQFYGTGLITKRERKVLSGNPINIEVLPLPEIGKPLDFTGMVGFFDISVNVEKNEIKQNEPLEVEVMIKGQGNIEMIHKPSFVKPNDVRVIESDVSVKVLNSIDKLTGWKKFKYVIIPKKSGKLVLNSFKSHYLDPKTGQYVEIETDPIEILVHADLSQREEPREKSRKADDDRNHLLIQKELISKEQTDLLSTMQKYGRLLAAGLVMLYLFLFVLRRKKEYESKNRKSIQSQKAYRRFKKEQHRIVGLIRGGKEVDSKKISDRLAENLKRYIQEKVKLKDQLLSVRDLEVQLEKTNLSSELSRDFMNLMEACEQGQFSAESLEVNHLERLAERAMKIIKKIEDLNLKERKE